MIKSKLFFRFALLGTLISAVMLIVSIFTAKWMREIVFAEPFRDRGPFRAVERIIENMPTADRTQGLRDLVYRGPVGPDGRPAAPGPRDEDLSTSAPGEPNRSPFFDFILVSNDGEILFPDSVEPKKAAEVRAIVKGLAASTGEVERLNDQYLVRKLRGTPTQYLARGSRFKPPSPPMKQIALLTTVQMFAMVLAVLSTLAAVLYSLRRRADEAEHVIHELSAGNLKARIPITKMDEIGTVLLSFNKMADEIEYLIEHLRKTEHSRRDLLRELAHDLRTPVASLKSLIETVNERSDQLSAEKRRELLDLAMREADYFEGLVDDLLFLGRVQEPRYKTSEQKFDLRELVRMEIETISHRHPSIEVEYECEREIDFDGDPGLMKRLVRNAIENAASFARSRVSVHLRLTTDGQLEILVRDDGPGFDANSLASFGQRKYSRAISTSGSKRISIGLGSVIMKSIADVHRGELLVSNRTDDAGDGAVLGADVLIRLPFA